MKQMQVEGNSSNLYVAFVPLQGYADAVYRRAHWECVGGVDEYYTPVITMRGM